MEPCPELDRILDEIRASGRAFVGSPRAETLQRCLERALEERVIDIVAISLAGTWYGRGAALILEKWN